MKNSMTMDDHGCSILATSITEVFFTDVLKNRCKGAIMPTHYTAFHQIILVESKINLVLSDYKKVFT